MRFPERERDREPGVSRKYILLPHPSPRPAGRQDHDCRPVPTHVILTRTISQDCTLAIPAIPAFPYIFLVYSTGSLHSSRTVHFRVSLSTYPDYPAPYVRSGFGLRYSQLFSHKDFKHAVGSEIAKDICVACAHCTCTFVILSSMFRIEKGAVKYSYS